MFNLLPKDTIFFDLFESLSQRIVESVEKLQQLAAKFPDIEQEIQDIRIIEKAADDLTHKALDRLDRTFITPFDREDIHVLVGRMDDIVDAVDDLAKRFKLYHVKKMEPSFAKQTDVLAKSTKSLSKAVHQLRKSRKLTDLSDYIIEIHRLENVGDENTNNAMSQLFDGATDPLEVMKWKELFDLIETAINGCESVSNVLERIVLKNG